jgi:hypothetical protein
MPKATTRNPNPAQRSPAQRVPRSLPADRSKKLGGGTLLTPADTAGPNRFQPTVNAQAQSGRSNAASFTPAEIARAESTNARVVDRADVALPSAYGEDAPL